MVLDSGDDEVDDQRRAHAARQISLLHGPPNNLPGSAHLSPVHSRCVLGLRVVNAVNPRQSRQPDACGRRSYRSSGCPRYLALRHPATAGLNACASFMALTRDRDVLVAVVPGSLQPAAFSTKAAHEGERHGTARGCPAAASLSVTRLEWGRHAAPAYTDDLCITWDHRGRVPGREPLPQVGGTAARLARDPCARMVTELGEGKDWKGALNRRSVRVGP